MPDSKPHQQPPTASEAHGHAAEEEVLAGGSAAVVDAGQPSEVAELVAALREYVWRVVGIAVDGTPETLPLVDHYVELVRAEREKRPEILDLVVVALGAYFGEVLRRQIGGFWHLPSADVFRWRVCSRRVLVAVNPVGVAYDVLYQGAEHDGPSAEVELSTADRNRVAPRLAALPGVTEREYYLLSTRVEVIEIIIDALSAFHAGNEADFDLDWEDFADLVKTD
ncbi:MAG: hypothetical protein JW751_08190 [Polyangiaceae bacterium]|nr:hypothetical protein [Polyangiaceae bacterium]